MNWTFVKYKVILLSHILAFFNSNHWANELSVYKYHIIRKGNNRYNKYIFVCPLSISFRFDFLSKIFLSLLIHVFNWGCELLIYRPQFKCSRINDTKLLGCLLLLELNTMIMTCIKPILLIIHLELITIFSSKMYFLTTIHWTLWTSLHIQKGILVERSCSKTGLSLFFCIFMM